MPKQPAVYWQRQPSRKSRTADDTVTQPEPTHCMTQEQEPADDHGDEHDHDDETSHTLPQPIEPSLHAETVCSFLLIIARIIRHVRAQLKFY